MFIETQELPNITPSMLNNLQYEVSVRRQLLHQIVTTFENRYNCSLQEFEQKLNRLEIDEHPAWEDSIEWRNGIEQLERIQLTETIFLWLQNLLKRSAVS
jgi:DNA integrity scanning protein DisA with diadenylate cyclase activity